MMYDNDPRLKIFPEVPILNKGGVYTFQCENPVSAERLYIIVEIKRIMKREYPRIGEFNEGLFDLPHVRVRND